MEMEGKRGTDRWEERRKRDTEWLTVKKRERAGLRPASPFLNSASNVSFEGDLYQDDIPTGRRGTPYPLYKKT